MIREGSGNLLEAPVEALVNTVNCVGVMGKGIALQFRKAWPDMFEDYRRAVSAGELRLGRMHVYETGTLVGPRLIINFPTKGHWRHKSRLADIEAGLGDLVRVIEEAQIRSVAIPPLGSGLGGLDWAEVKPLIAAKFAPLTGVEVLLWEPGHVPRAAERPVRTKRPVMTSARAMVLALMDRYRILDHAITHLETQKLAYFLERAGAPLGMRFQPHIYGPYSDALYHMLQTLEGHHICGLVDRNPWAPLSLEPEGVNEAGALLDNDDAARACFEAVQDLIEGFQTPYGLELLSTADWLARDTPAVRESPDACVHALADWPSGSERKRRIMRREHVAIAWHRLAEKGWFERHDAPPAEPAAGPAG
ncbi:MAG: Appr-1-p processing protein [Deltaproteobacteria bacterium]|nr:MAG: Appr-1-p processing protein [Deltaproteobacteria bacterium]